ncbi:MAG: tellurite resistance/C4-dicarboxylate transporter family protein [Burkholderiaceae bacterium]
MSASDLSRPPPPAQPLAQLVAGLSPASFGIVMATGIVSIAVQQLGLPTLARVLLLVNAVLYAGLWVLTAARLLRHTARIVADLRHHARSPGFFSTVAASGVLGCQCLLVGGPPTAALALWWLTLGLWLVLTYGIFATLTTIAVKPTLDRGIGGAWLLAVVATQSVAVLGVLLAPRLGEGPRLALHFLALALWLWGGMLYIWIMTLIFYRYTFFTLAAVDLTPPYWINMGAMAISALAGSLLAQAAPQAPFLQSMRPFIEGFTLLCWASGTWWIPLLLVLEVWRYAIRHVPLRYDPMYWAVVFPLGMYSVCTRELTHALELNVIDALPPLFGLAALVAWVLACADSLLRAWQWGVQRRALH